VVAKCRNAEYLASLSQVARLDIEMETKVSKCGDRIVVAIPENVAAQLEWKPGDILSAELVDGGVRFVRTMTAHDHAMEIARKIMDEYHETFAALAKS
jgi:antitoxin component of MazEF toxin-antitoxin module